MLTAFFDRVINFLKTYKNPSELPNKAKLQKKFLKKDHDVNKENDFIDSKNQSMQDSQGKSDFSGSAYKSPGNVDHEKRNSNMSQRNF